MHLGVWLLLAVFYQTTKSENLPTQKNQTVIASTQIELLERRKCTGWNNANATKVEKCVWHNRSLKCSGSVDKLEIISNLTSKIHHVVFCNWTNETFDPSILASFRKLRSIHLEYGALAEISGDFPHLPHLTHINISYTRLSHMQPTLLRNLTKIRKIDLRWNQFDYYDGLLDLPKHYHELYLNGNPFNCSHNFKWLMNHSKTKHIVDRKLLQCSDTRFKNQTILTVMHFKKSLREMCHNNIELRNCTCALSYIALDLDEISRPMYTVNCSGLNLTRLPRSVPENTTSFYAQHNNISDIEPLLNAYRSVHDIYLDNNQISTIEILETDNWLEHFRAFSLKGNQLTKLPIYLLNNALECNHHAGALYLSGNPWRCDCNFMLRFQELLQSHRDIIKDASDIQCYKQDGEDTIHYSVLALKRHDICILPTEYTIQPIDMLNIVLGISVLFIICKLSYDYYNFRVYGHLPWIVTKMP